MKNNSYQESLEIILAHSQPLEVESVTFHQSLNRVLAEDVVATVDDPPAAKSAMDGYCLRAEDTKDASPDNPVILPFSGSLGAGHLPDVKLQPHQALKIMTGALLPDGADAVVKQEDTKFKSEDLISFEKPIKPEENITVQGAHMKQGEQVFCSGEWISPQGIGMLAKLGKSQLQVYKQPRVAILAIGDELIEVDHSITQPGQLHVSNLYSLEAAIYQYGGIPYRLGIAKDDPNHIEQLLQPYVFNHKQPDTLACNMIITLGGSLRGDFDFAHTVLENIGANVHFRRTEINLGPSTIFATLDRTLFFGLPGTPVPSWGAFELLVRPALWKMAGRIQLNHPVIQAHLKTDLKAKPSQSAFAPGWLSFNNNGIPEVAPLQTHSTNNLPPALLANGLIRLPEGQTKIQAGETVLVEWIETQNSDL